MLEMKSIAMLSSLALVTSAQPAGKSDGDEAKGRRELARILFSQQRYEDALAALKEAHRLSPGAATVLTIADTYRYLGVREEKAARGLKDRSERASARTRAEMLYREAYNWIEEAGSLPMTETDREDADALRARIRPHVAVVDIATEPEAQAVLVDGEPSRPRKSVAVSSGEHRILVRVPGYRDEEAGVRTRLGDRRPLRLVLERLFAPVRVVSEPPGARVELSGASRASGTTPFTSTVPVAVVRVSLTLDGYLPETRELEVVAGEGASLSVQLEHAPSTLAKLSVTGEPSGAAVSVEGRPMGLVPLALEALPTGSGRARVQVAAPGRVPWSDLVALEGGASTRIRVDLPAVKTPLGLGWRIAGYGLGVAGAATGGVVGIWAVRERTSFYQNPSTDHIQMTNRLNWASTGLIGAGVALAVTTFVVHLITLGAPASRAEVSLDR